MWGTSLDAASTIRLTTCCAVNTPTMPELIDKIARYFVAHYYDVQHLIRTICATEAYQLAASAYAKPYSENMYWTRRTFHLVPLGPEELLDVLRGLPISRSR